MFVESKIGPDFMDALTLLFCLSFSSIYGHAFTILNLYGTALMHATCIRLNTYKIRVKTNKTVKHGQITIDFICVDL